jgi:hypothetical protein
LRSYLIVCLILLYSPNVAKAFGRPGPSDGKGLQVMDFFVEQMKNNFILWNADPDVLTQVKLLP